jgi:hypothetical protein
LTGDKTHAILLRGDNRIENPTNAIIEQIIDRTETKSNTFNLQIRKAESFEVSKHIDMSFNIGIKFFKKLNVKLNLGARRSIEGNFSLTEKNKQ